MPATFPPTIESIQADARQSNESWIGRASLCLAVTAGIFLRLWNYFHNPPLWLDEASLSMNIVHRTFAGLLQPLDYDQAAPVGFLILVKAVTRLFGSSEYILRLVPLLAGCTLLLLAARLGRKTLGWQAATLFVAILALSQNLLKYSVQIKQYSSDATLAMLLLMSAMSFANQRIRRGGMIFWSTLTAVSPWLSHPSVFVIGGTVAVLVLVRLKERCFREAAAVAIIGMLGAISFFASYVKFDQAVEKNAYLQYFWRDGYMPTDSPGHAAVWCIHTLKAASGVPLGEKSFLFVLGGVLLGIIALIRRRQFTLLLLLIAPAMLAFFAATIHRYPFQWRLLCFLIPAAAYLSAEGVDWLSNILPGSWRWMALLTGIGMLMISACKDALTLRHPMVLHRIPPVLGYIARHRQPDEPVCTVNLSRSLYAYYAPRFGLPAATEIISSTPQDITGYTDQFHGRVWLIVIKIDDRVLVMDKGPFQEFEKHGRRIDHAQSTAVDGYEYEMP